MRCLPDDSEDRGHGQQSPLVDQVLLGGVLDVGGQGVALHPAVVRAHQEDEPEEEAGEEPVRRLKTPEHMDAEKELPEAEMEMGRGRRVRRPSGRFPSDVWTK